MSAGKWIIPLLKILPQWAVKPIAFRYVAGEKISDALRVVKTLNAAGIKATVDVLGESAKDEAYAKRYVEEYKALLDSAHKENLDCGISVKPTAFGMAFSNELAFACIRDIINHASAMKKFVRIDMEDSPYTDRTIDYYNRYRKDFPKVGVVLQAYLKRTMKDIQSFNGAKADLRLCKGIYIEPENIAIKDYQKIRDNYLACLREIFKLGYRVGIATHDQYLIDGAKKIIAELKPAEGSYEFQMLYGVRSPTAKALAKEGHRVRVYVPYGEDWYAYCMRRMNENPNVAWHVTKALFVDTLLWPFRKLAGK